MATVRGVLYALLLVFGMTIAPAALPQVLIGAVSTARTAQDPASDPFAEPTPLSAPDSEGASPSVADAVSAYSLLLSGSADHSNPVSLQDQTVSGNIYVFASPEAGIKRAQFFIDDTSASGTPVWTDNNAPWDFAGGNSKSANAYDTRQLSDGPHTITALLSLSDGSTVLTTASFAVYNLLDAAKPVPPTPTSAPATYVSYLSTSPDRSNSVLLAGRTVSGNVYVFVGPEAGITQARFFIDNTSATGTPYRTENLAPWDLAGGDGPASPFDTRQLSNGGHSLSVSLSLSSGATVVITSSFTVNNVTATATPLPPSPTPTRTASPAPATYASYLSTSPDRSNPVLLVGRTVSGNIYVFVAPESGITQIRFFLDNPAGSGTPIQTENTAPWDFAGGSSTAATAYDTRKLSNGAHTITASITLTSGQIVGTSASFTIDNGAATATPKPGPIYWGVNMPGLPDNPAGLTAWERDVAGKGASIAHWGQRWDFNNGGYRPWPSQYIGGIRNRGSIPMITWTPEGGTDPTRWQLRKIIDGVHDAYIRQFATDAKNWGQPFFLRIMHEMNGAWGWPWQEDSNANKRGEFVPAWRHIIDIFRSAGATNASFVWCPNVDWNGSPNPTYASLYPGDSYVDWICLDGYNWGTTRPWGWDSFDEVFNWSYNQIVQVAPSKPMMLGEFGSVEGGGSKSAWLTDAMSTQIPGNYTKIRAAVYFNWNMDGADWRIETSQTSISAWKGSIGSSYYASNSFGALTGKIPVP